jgi:hypothetical protein
MAMATSTIIGLLSAAASAAAAAKSSSGSKSGGTTTDDSGSSPELTAAINSMMARQKSQDPLFQALTNLGVNLLPNSAYKKYPGRTYGELFPTGDTTVKANVPGAVDGSPRRIPSPDAVPVPGKAVPRVPVPLPDPTMPDSRYPKRGDPGYEWPM